MKVILKTQFNDNAGPDGTLNIRERIEGKFIASMDVYAAQVLVREISAILVSYGRSLVLSYTRVVETSSGTWFVTQYHWNYSTPFPVPRMGIRNGVIAAVRRHRSRYRAYLAAEAREQRKTN